MWRLRNDYLARFIFIVLAVAFLSALFAESSCTDKLFGRITGRINPLMCDRQLDIYWNPAPAWNTYETGGATLIVLSLFVIAIYGAFHG